MGFSLCVNAPLVSIVNIVTNMASNMIIRLWRTFMNTSNTWSGNLVSKGKLYHYKNAILNHKILGKNGEVSLRGGVQQNSLSKHYHPSHMFLK